MDEDYDVIPYSPERDRFAIDLDQHVNQHQHEDEEEEEYQYEEEAVEEDVGEEGEEIVDEEEDEVDDEEEGYSTQRLDSQQKTFTNKSLVYLIIQCSVNCAINCKFITSSH